MNKPKIIALYLPQFHEIPENNEWWGKGFTEWVNVKKAKPLFNGHQQPRIPLNNNYYDLTDKKSFEWQVDLAKKNGVYGFCFYHYRFSGKKLLEKPAELFLKNMDLDLNFCLSWANEPWSRNWDGGNKSVLMDQDYGDETDWINHFNYLLDFFKDNRYIKINNKPMFVIYRTSNNEEVIEKMFEFWNNLAIKNGFFGIHFVETLNSFQFEPNLKISESVMEFEPMYTFDTFKYKHIFRIFYRFISAGNKYLKLNFIKKISYDLLWKNIIKRNKNYGKNKFLGGFVGWDNTARKANRGLVVTGSTPSKFGYYLNEQIKKLDNTDNNFVFINAWNEWAEGTYLEPDTNNEYGYLNEIKNIINK